MTDETPPLNYEALIQRIHDRHDGMSKTYQRISVYLTQNPNEVAIKSINAIAEHCGIHASSFVRFGQSFGYKGFKELQALFQRRLITAAPGFEARVRALQDELEIREDRSEIGFLRDLIVQDIASLEELLNDTENADLVRAADLLFEAETIYLLGQLRSAPVVELLRYTLTMLGKKCILLDPGGGLATYMARTISPKDVLFAVSFRYYANEVVDIADEARAHGIPIVAISDSTLSPLAKTAEVLFAVPEHDQTFSRSLAAPISLAQAIVVAVAARIQETKSVPELPTVTGVSANGQRPDKQR